jgi:hypothetical protein
VSAMTLEDFERRYRDNPDPWGYTNSDYERRKYLATLAACGTGPFLRALELGGSIGVFSELLAPHCGELITLDGSATAVGIARGRLGSRPNVDVRLGVIPEEIPVGPLALVVASEILYYLSPAALAATLSRLEQVMASGGRLVCVHWRPAGPERPLDAAAVHQLVAAQPWLQRSGSASTDKYLLDVLERW